jgi:hypothetical protein
MELTLHPNWPSLIIQGPRVRPGIGPLTSQSHVEQVLVGIVKVTLKADDPTATPLTQAQQTPIFMKDEPYDEDSMKHEHDMATYKPKADIIVLGAPSPPQPVSSGTEWTETVRIQTQSMSENFSDASDPRFTFGWQDRKTEPRLPYAGDCDAFNPAVMELPSSFDNRFNNGGFYDDGTQPSFTYPMPGAVVRLESSVGGSTKTHRLYLPPVTPSAAVRYGSIKQAVPMKIDTVVYDKSTGLFYVVWRGVWKFDAVAPERYVSFTLS